MQNPLPSINHAYSFLLQDENQREVYTSPLNGIDSSSFMVGGQAQNTSRGTKYQPKNAFGNTKKPNFGLQKSENSKEKFQNTGYKGKKSKYNPNVSYTCCKKISHTIEQCYRLIGFPEDF